MQRKKWLICAIIGIVLLTVGNLPAQAGNVGKFAWQLEPFCDVIVLQVSQESGVFAVHGLDRGDAPPVCPDGPFVFSAHGAANPGPGGVIILGFNVIFPGVAPHFHAELNPTSLSGPWIDDFGFTGNLKFLGPAPGAPLAATDQPSYRSSRNK